MAFIRRTLTDRPALLPTGHRPSYAPPSSLRRLLMGRSRPYPPRKWAHYQSQQPAWNRSLLLRLSLFFLLGFLLGLSPFSGLHEGAARVGPIEPSFESPLLLPPPNQRDRGNPPRAGQQIEVVAKAAALEAEKRDSDPREPFQKLLIVVTPTYSRALQAFYLTRLAHTLRLLPPPLLWIVTETGSASPETAKLLRTAGVMYRHLTCANISSNIKDRGVHQRNAALQHIELHRLDGIVYFADDDNIYSLELFERMREIRRFGTWPVAMLAQSKNKATLEGPVCNGSQVIGWHTNEKSERLRRFHVDMSGFAFNSTILWDPKRWHRPTSAKIRQLDTVKEGFQETTFIEQLVEDESQMEAIPNGCSRVMNWHLHLEAKNLVYPRGWQISRNLDVVIHLQ